jgi:hypothetical protein
VASGGADAGAVPGRAGSGPKETNRVAVRESWAETQTRLAVASARDAEAREAALRRAEADAKAQAALAAEERRRAAEEVIELSSDEEEEAVALGGGKENESALAAARRLRREAYEAHIERSSDASSRNRKETEKEKETFRNPLLDPPRYEPSAAPSAGDLRLSTDERAEIADVGLAWYPCSACLDTGNAGCTLIAQELATRMGLCDGLGVPTGGFAGYVEVRGVVAGAAERLAKVHVTYRIKGKTMRVWAGITRAGLGCDLLVSRNDIVEFERDGYTLSAR